MNAEACEEGSRAITGDGALSFVFSRTAPTWVSNGCTFIQQGSLTTMFLRGSTRSIMTTGSGDRLSVPCSASYKCVCALSAPFCEHTDGRYPHLLTNECRCGTVSGLVCAVDRTGMFCNANASMCSFDPIPACDDATGKIAHASSRKQCVCGEKGKVCAR